MTESRMDLLAGVLNDVRVRLSRLTGWLNGCSHGRTTFPITLAAGIGTKGLQGTRRETYVVCLVCGRRFGYDWSTMRMTTARAAREEKPDNGGA